VVRKYGSVGGIFLVVLVYYLSISIFVYTHIYIYIYIHVYIYIYIRVYMYILRLAAMRNARVEISRICNYACFCCVTSCMSLI